MAPQNSGDPPKRAAHRLTLTAASSPPSYEASYRRIVGDELAARRAHRGGG